MKSKHIIFFLIFIGVVFEAKSQISVPYHSIMENKEILLRESIPNAPIIELPFINNEEEYERLNAECNHCNIIGKQIPVDITMSNSGVWATLSTGKRIWQLRLKSPTAEGLRFICDNYQLPKGGLLFIKDNETDVIYGAFTELNNKETNTFATRFFNTKDITIIYETGTNNTEQFIPNFHISKLSHALDRRVFGNALPCHNDVNCAPWVTEWCNEIRATVHFVLDGGLFDTFCSGVLLNNINNDFAPYILTSRHCTEDMNLATSIVVYNFQSPTCDPLQNGNDLLTTDGINILYQSGKDDDEVEDFVCTKDHDVAFVEVLNSAFPTPIPWNYNIFFAGWNSLKVNKGATVTGIHHPAGDVKKISEGTILSNLSTKCWRVEWDNGIVEGGSSGSPLFGSDHRVVGNLSTGSIAAATVQCNSDFFVRYGKLQKYFDDIDGWLAPNSPSTVAINGIDPIGSCQDDLLLYGDFFPAHDWQLENSITVQAQNTIVAAPSGIPTEIRGSHPAHNNLNNTSDYTFRAGQSVSLKNGFRVERGNIFKAKIGECEVFQGCGFNYQERISPIDTEAEAENIIVIDKSNQTNTGESNNSKIYPNPTTNEITIESLKSYHLTIFNMMGQQVGQENGKAKTVQYDMTKFEAGIYIFQFRFEDGTMETIRVIKQ